MPLILCLLGVFSLCTLVFSAWLDDDLTVIDWLYITSGGTLIAICTLAFALFLVRD